MLHKELPSLQRRPAASDGQAGHGRDKPPAGQQGSIPSQHWSAHGCCGSVWVGLLAPLLDSSSYCTSTLQARDVYEEAIRTVMTVRDFTQVFDSYAQFEESMIAAKMETASELGREEEGAMWDCGLGRRGLNS